MSVIMEQQVIRAVVSLCSVAAQSELDDVRDDMRDAAALLVRLATPNGSAPGNELRRWCDDTLATLDILSASGDAPSRTISAAQLSVLRLRSWAPVPASKVVPPKKPAANRDIASSARSLNGNQKKILQFIAGHAPARTKEIIENFTGTLSDRTVKRALKELADLSLIRRSEFQGSVSYEAVLDQKIAD
jgi:hypothetical protein